MSSCFSNESPTFQPAMRIISSVTQAKQAVVTTSSDHDFIEGEIVRFYIPKDFGMRQMDKLTTEIEVIDDTSFRTSIDTRGFDSFSAPSPLPDAYTCAQVVPIGEVNSTLRGATQNVLPNGER